jgi:tetratricopeptide (TPR) repeat protein
VPIRISVPVAGDPPAKPMARAVPELPPVPEPELLVTPAIADPRSELLVTEARTARIAGDMGAAIVKLEEALGESPGDPTVLYELGMVHEMMGVYEKAADYYEKVFQLGLSGAGNLYEAAAAKLRDGFEQPHDMLGKLALGRVRIFNDPKAEGGQRVVLTVPVQKAPGEEVEAAEIEVAVTFFNKTDKNRIIQLEDESWAEPTWVSLPFDWAGGEESLRMNYRIPVRDEQTAHLFGELSYYGQVVTLSYKGEVLDVQAWPRDLAARIGQAAPLGSAAGDFPEFLDQDILPPYFDPDIRLLNLLHGE